MVGAALGDYSKQLWWRDLCPACVLRSASRQACGATASYGCADGRNCDFLDRLGVLEACGGRNRDFLDRFWLLPSCSLGRAGRLPAIISRVLLVCKIVCVSPTIRFAEERRSHGKAGEGRAQPGRRGDGRGRGEGVLAGHGRRGPGGPRAGVRAHDRDDAQGRAGGPPGLPQQRQVAQADGQPPQRPRPEGRARERRRAGGGGAPRPGRPVRAGRRPQGPPGPSGMEGRVMSVCARGMSQRGIAPTVRETRGLPMGAETAPAVTDRAWGEPGRRRSRPLGPACAFLFADPPPRAGREGARGPRRGRLRGPGLRPAGPQGRARPVGGRGRGARRRAQVFDEPRRRGPEGAACACAGGAAGLEDGPRSVSPPPGPGAAPSTWRATP